MRPTATPLDERQSAIVADAEHREVGGTSVVELPSRTDTELWLPTTSSRQEGSSEKVRGVNALEGFYSFGRGPSGAERQTAQGIAGFQRDNLRVGAQYLWQERQSGDETLSDQLIGVWSGFADFVEGDLGGTETGRQAPFSTWIAGGEWFLHPAVRFGPNLEIVGDSHDPDPVQLPGRRQDAILRFTFYWTF